MNTRLRDLEIIALVVLEFPNKATPRILIRRPLGLRALRGSILPWDRIYCDGRATLLHVELFQNSSLNYVGPSSRRTNQKLTVRMNHFITATHLEAMVPKMKALRSFVECSFPFLIRGCLAKEPRVVITGLTIGLIYFAPTRPPILHKSPASPASNFSIQRPTSFENLPLPVVLSTLKSQARPDSGISSPLFISSRGMLSITIPS